VPISDTYREIASVANGISMTPLPVRTSTRLASPDRSRHGTPVSGSSSVGSSGFPMTMFTSEDLPLLKCPPTVSRTGAGFRCAAARPSASDSILASCSPALRLTSSMTLRTRTDSTLSSPASFARASFVLTAHTCFAIITASSSVLRCLSTSRSVALSFSSVRSCSVSCCWLSWT
jgi:hypothetical protein